MNTKYTTVFFDLDDTLWDTANNNKQALKEIFDIYHWGDIFGSFSDFYTSYRTTNEHLWHMYSKGEITKENLLIDRLALPLGSKLNLSLSDVKSLSDQLIGRMAQKTLLVPYARQILEYLSTKYSLFIISNGFKEIQYLKIQNSSLSSFFKSVILSDEVGAVKPSKLIFDIALKEAQCSAEQTILVGDNLSSDIIGAYNSGIDQIWYNPKNMHSNDFTPTYTISTLKEIESIL